MINLQFFDPFKKKIIYHVLKLLIDGKWHDIAMRRFLNSFILIWKANLHVLAKALYYSTPDHFTFASKNGKISTNMSTILDLIWSGYVLYFAILQYCTLRSSRKGLPPSTSFPLWSKFFLTTMKFSRCFMQKKFSNCEERVLYSFFLIFLMKNVRRKARNAFVFMWTN